MQDMMDEGGCSSRAPYALMVYGDQMEPEFKEGAVIIVDPDQPYGHGAYVVADYEGEVYFRRFEIREQQAYLIADNSKHPEIKLISTYNVRGVITQQSRNRKLGVERARHYI